jgi:hypothetical protein
MMKKQDLAERVITGMAMLGLGLFSLHHLSNLDISPGAKSFPQIIGLVLAVLSLMLIASTIWTYIRSKSSRAEKIVSNGSSSRLSHQIASEIYPFITSVLAILFLLSFDWIGFEISGFALMFAIMLIINRKEAIGKIYYAVATPAILILIFKMGMKIRLPLLLQQFFE